MAKKRKDLTGNVYGELTVLKYSHNHQQTRSPMWLCRCSCGNEKAIYGYALEHGYYKSCGCMLSERRNAGANNHIKQDMVGGTRKSALRAKLHKDNTSGYKGVTYDKLRKKWRAYIGFKGKHINLGYYEEIVDAIEARHQAEIKYYEPILGAENNKKYCQKMNQ